MKAFLLVLLLAAPASAFLWRGEVCLTGAPSCGKMAISGRRTPPYGELRGRFTCKGRGCPMKAGRVRGI